MSLQQVIEEFLLERGAIKVRFANRESLAGGPPSTGLTPTDPIPEEESFCVKCKTCVGTCVGGMFSRSEEDSVTLGGKTFFFSRRIDLNRCNLVCGGFTGLHKNGHWMDFTSR